MQNFANFISVVRIPGSHSTLKQGVKGGRRPKGALAGSNGSFVMPGESAKVYLTLEYNENMIIKNIYSYIRNHVSRVTDNTCPKLEKVFKNFKFKIKNGEIVNLDEAIEKALG